MGDYTLTTFKAYLKVRLGNTTALDTPTDYLTPIVNSAYRSLTTKNKFWGMRKQFYFPQLEVNTSENTTDGTAYIAVPSDALMTRYLYNTTSDTYLSQVPFDRYVKTSGRATASSEGAPTTWIRRGGYYYLNPTPDATYAISVFYRKIPAALSGASDVTLIDSSWDPIILEYAVVKGYQWLQQYDKAEVVRKELTEELSDKFGTYEKEDETKEVNWTPSPQYYDFEY
jgi:hypothetical protein